ncbi:hypothetical protein Mgra_00007894 [Meloidogyne graminicola]|uniref:Uncharacterized protein n=1 Tax=Meloidogyne graminicola TaxID=189291 RepID=A0A8S9ZH70_9BILA|nr:hypothetical protein Mgra_00007894 [Meloidogyne graminicola]
MTWVILNAILALYFHCSLEGNKIIIIYVHCLGFSILKNIFKRFNLKKSFTNRINTIIKIKNKYLLFSKIGFLCLNIPQLCVCNKIKQSSIIQDGVQTKVNEGYTNYIITSKVVDCSASCVTNGDFGLPSGMPSIVFPLGSNPRSYPSHVLPFLLLQFLELQGIPLYKIKVSFSTPRHGKVS